MSPLHPQNISDRTVMEKGTPFTVELTGVSECDENGFIPVTNGFYLSPNKMYVHIADDGTAFTDYEKKSDTVLKGKYCSAYVDYEKYSFCGETYKTKEDLQKFFNTYDPIYNFDINKMSEYVSDVINYEKKFSGKATIQIYRGKFVITEIFIGDEKILVHNDI